MILTSKLNPPIINGKLPAFYGNEIVIPFTLNRSVGFNQFDAMKIIIKTVSTGTKKAVLENGVTQNNEDLGRVWYDSSQKVYKASFKFQTKNKDGNNYFDNPQIGQYYKIQIACINNAQVSDEQKIGYYSTVGVIKYTAQPELYIRDLDAAAVNKNVYEYVGVYLQENDLSEKIYSYKFDLYDEFDNIVATSGMNIHNNTTDIDVDSSVDTWRVRKNLIQNKPYYLQYKAITLNGLGELVPCESPKYKIMELDVALPDISASLSAKLNDVEGYIQLSLIGHRIYNDTRLRSGSFILLRSSSKDNYDSWEQLTEFQLSLYDPHADFNLYKDYVVEQGVKYIYAIQAYNQQGYMSGRLKNYEGEVLCDFEDAFLYDGERQLKIRFNPSISNFKSTILENKVDTIGSKYPFIFRNGIVNYKEFSISGLLSLLGDENEQFLSGLIDNDSHLRVGSPGSIKDIAPVESLHLLTGNNYYKEREFKLKALEWLSNGQPKLFKSPAEGNYIVRLMGVTLAPEETLGRMLHTFNCSACEIAAYEFESLDKYNLIPGYSEKDLKYYTIDLNNVDLHFKPIDPTQTNTIMLPQSYEAKIIGKPRTAFKYILANDKTEYETFIGANGIFEFPIEQLEKYPLVSIVLTDKTKTWGDNATLIFGYRDPNIKTFSYIHNVSAIENQIKLPQDFDDSDYENLPEEDIVLPPFFDGVVLPEPEPDPIPPEPETPPEDGEEQPKPEKPKFWMKDLLKFLEDLRKKTGMFNYIKIMMRKMYQLKFDGNKVIGFIKDKDLIPFNGDYSIFNPDDLYVTNDGKFYDGFDLFNKHSWDFVKPLSEITHKFALNDKFYDLNYYGDKTLILTDVASLQNFKIGNGIKLDMVYQEKDIFYTIEQAALKAVEKGETPPVFYSLRLEWEQAVQNKASKKEISQKYNAYLNALESALNELESELKVGADYVTYAI